MTQLSDDNKCYGEETAAYIKSYGTDIIKSCQRTRLREDRHGLIVNHHINMKHTLLPFAVLIFALTGIIILNFRICHEQWFYELFII